MHRMELFGEYFDAIRERKKIVEDTIEFIKVPQQTELRSYDTFEAMYNVIPFKDFDCQGWTLKEMIDGTYEIYTPEQEKEWGTLAIIIEY